MIEGNITLKKQKILKMNNYYVIETKQDSSPKVFKVLGELSAENARIKFKEFVMDNMKNLGYEYLENTQSNIDFKGKGFYAKNQEQTFIKWSLDLMEFEYDNTKYKLLK